MWKKGKICENMLEYVAAHKHDRKSNFKIEKNS